MQLYDIWGQTQDDVTKFTGAKQKHVLSVARSTDVWEFPME